MSVVHRARTKHVFAAEPCFKIATVALLLHSERRNPEVIGIQHIEARSNHRAGDLEFSLVLGEDVQVFQPSNRQSAERDRNRAAHRKRE